MWVALPRTLDIEWQCGRHCHSALSVQSRAGGTATRARAYRFGTFNVEWQCGRHCHSALSVQSRAGSTATRARAYRSHCHSGLGRTASVRSTSSGSVGGTATRARACSPVRVALPLGPGRTVLVRSTSSGSVGGAAPCARRQVAAHTYVSSRQAQAPPTEGPQVRSRGGEA